METVVIPGWIGWFAAGVIVAAFVLLFIRQRRKKAADTRSHHIVLIDGFPVVHVPVAVSRETAEVIGETLREVYRDAWAALDAIYDAEEESGPMPIATIGMSVSPVEDGHPHVMWIAPRDKIFLRLEEKYGYWFARELHNIFRYLMHGIEHIYRTTGPEDQLRAHEATEWIEGTYG